MSIKPQAKPVFQIETWGQLAIFSSSIVKVDGVSARDLTLFSAKCCG